MFLSFDRRSIGLKEVSRTGFKLIFLEIFSELYFLDSFVE
jgi:hypothetical protein